MVRRLREAVNEADQDQHLDESTRRLSDDPQRVADHAPEQPERSRPERREARDPSRNRAYLQSLAARISATLELIERVRRSKENEERLLSDGNRPDEISRWRDLGITGPAKDPSFREAELDERKRWRESNLDERGRRRRD